MRKTHIFLIGFMGCGKSTVAECLCRNYGIKQIEMDRQIEKKEGRSISCIFEQEGEAFFRNLEAELLKNLGEDERLVISCGGGVPMKEENVREMKKKGVVVLLKAKAKTVCERIKNTHHRPLLEKNMNESYIEELMEKRRVQYEQAADFDVETDGRTALEISNEIMKRIEEEERI